MSLEEINKYLQENIFTEVATQQTYRFINTTMNVNGHPLTFYSLEENNGEFYIKHDKALTSTNPMLLRIDVKPYSIQVDFVDQNRGKLFCRLVSNR